MFLVGLGIGSSLGSAIARAVARPRVALGWCQMLLCARDRLGGVHADAVAAVLAGQPVDLDRPWFNFQLDLVRCSGSCCRARFSGARASRWRWRRSRHRGQDPARLVGGVYAANTVGAIVGSLGASLLLVVWLGSQHAQQLLIVLSRALGAADAGAGGGRRARQGLACSGPARLRSVLATGGAGLLARTVPAVPGILVAYGRYAATWVGLRRTSSTSAKG